jgi:CIC family chloride channel protein
MSGNYGLLVPLMLVCIVNVAVLSSRWSLFEEQVPGPIDSPAHQGDFVIDVLEQLHVRDVMKLDRKLHLVPENTPLTEILRIASYAECSYFPVVDGGQKMVGIFSLRDLRAVLTGNGSGDLIVAADIATQPVLTVTPEDDLNSAMRRFTQKNIDYLPIVTKEDKGHVLGMLNRRDVISAYHERLSEIRQHD